MKLDKATQAHELVNELKFIEQLTGDVKASTITTIGPNPEYMIKRFIDEQTVQNVSTDTNYNDSKFRKDYIRKKVEEAIRSYNEALIQRMQIRSEKLKKAIRHL